MRRLYGEAGYQRLRRARIAVVGLGGVGSWAAEALARSGVAELWLIDLDHVAESNVNRQVQALGRTVGQAKALALRERIADIHPGCRVHPVEDFVDEQNWPGLLQREPIDALVDACDQVRAKAHLAAWAHATGVPLVCVGAAGGKRRPQDVQVDDLARVTHDPLLASLRQRVRRDRRAQPGDAVARPPAKASGAAAAPLGLRCVFSREAVQPPADAACSPDGSLNCHGYGSSVTVTATFGLVAANEAIDAVLRDL
ncbi:tRNA threonylcarbamoyladenosine dehydratase [Piscinibacter sakaiensis]|uniref:tRNA threonylcarbamoyladenosine dehydratase n=1 Tax=Piscinibacter sakaiensis TaxID=1547922 RepID=UPI0006B4C54A|nr:tRNA threonylcarbamoyladenosine dehydratase [Piscinibacter sakaiensis]